MDFEDSFVDFLKCFLTKFFSLFSLTPIRKYWKVYTTDQNLIEQE